MQKVQVALGCCERSLKPVSNGQFSSLVANFWQPLFMRPVISNDADQQVIVPQFYYSRTFPYLIQKHRAEILRRLKDVPETFRKRELAERFTALGEARGEAPWQILRGYLDLVEAHIAAIVQRHSPGFWFHLHRRLLPVLAEVHDSKRDDVTVVLVRRIAELAYAKHGNLDNANDLGSIVSTRLETFLGGAWYEATTLALGSKLNAGKEYQAIKWTKQAVMTDFGTADLLDVFEIEGHCYEYWWASAAMRAIGKGAIAKWDKAANSIRYRDTGVCPVSFDIYDQRNSEGAGFHTRLGTWIDDLGDPQKFDLAHRDQIFFTQLTPNPEPSEYGAWNVQTRSIGRGYGVRNFAIGRFSLGAFMSENRFMAESFRQKHGIELDSILVALWAASFFGVFTGGTSLHLKKEQKLDRTMNNLGNLLFRGYTMVTYSTDQFAREAAWWAKQLGHVDVPDLAQLRSAVDFICLSKAAQQHIGLWSGGKRPILIPAAGGLMIDLAAIMPFLHTLFFGLRKRPQAGGEAFEESVRKALAARGLNADLQGKIRWPDGTSREVDASVRIGDRLILLECFSYELPLDYEVGKPSVFEARKAFILAKLDQAQSLMERIVKEPVGTNFDVSWAKTIDWRAVSPFVEFAWHALEPLFDEAGVPRVLQIRELLEYLTNGRAPARNLQPMLMLMREAEPKGIWY